jgi:FAD/FMN-containing dehydrogenase
MTELADPKSALRAELTGTVITCDHPDYDQACRVWNGEIDRRPAVIVRCATTEDVVAAVRHARTQDLELSVRGGAHSTSGLAVGDGGLVVDLSAMNSVEVDPDARRAIVGGGALLSDLDAATQAHDLAVPTGEVSHTGIGGLTLGGGMGWLTRQHGLTIDNLLAAEIVLADGRVLRLAEDDNPDLFWAIRGGGGNFGVVTRFEFRLHPVGPIVQVGLFFYRLDQGPEALRLARTTIPTLPDSVSFQLVAVNAPPAPFVPEEVRLRPGYALMTIGFGDPAEHDQVAQTLRRGLAPQFELVTPMPYVALQQMFDEANTWGVHCYEKGAYLTELTDPVIDMVTAHVARKTSPMSVVHFYLLDCAFSSVPDHATAFSGARSPRLAVFIVGITPDNTTLATERTWVRDFHTALTPHAMTAGGYINALLSDDAHRIPDSYGDKYARLAQIKAAVDPDNVFHRNHNIAPAAKISQVPYEGDPA